MPKVEVAWSNGNIMVVKDGAVAGVVGPSHPMYADIAAAAQNGEFSKIPEMINAKKRIEDRFNAAGMSCNIVESPSGIEVVLDGTTIKGRVASMITDFRSRGIPFAALLAFWKKWSKNPLEVGRDSLIDFLEANDVPLLPSGNFIAYKGVHVTNDPFVFISTHDPNFKYVLGVEADLPREQCTVDVENACGPGLHVGGFSHASGYGTVILEVEVNPFNVVSVPRRENSKLRACKVLPRRINTKRAPIETEYINLRSGVHNQGVNDKAISNVTGGPLTHAGDPVVGRASFAEDQTPAKAPEPKAPRKGGTAKKTTWYKVINGAVFKQRKVTKPGPEWTDAKPVACSPAPASKGAVAKPKKATPQQRLAVNSGSVKRTYYRTLPNGLVETCRAAKRPAGWTGERPKGFSKKPTKLN
jgi:hypothetical protein